MVRQTEQQKKEALLADLSAVRSDILRSAQALPRDKQDQVFLGIWDIKDLLAHLVGWDHTNLQMAHDFLDDRLPGFYQHYDRDWRSYNAELVSRYRLDDFSEMLVAAQVSHQQLMALLETIPPEAFFKDHGLRFKGYKVMLGRLLEAELGDEKTHLAQIQGFASDG